MQHYLSQSDQRELPNEKTAIVPIELAQIGNDVIVPIEMAQIPNVLFATGWSNHQLIMSRCKSDEQRLFYMLYAGREQLEYKEQLQVGGVIQRSLVEFCKFLKK